MHAACLDSTILVSSWLVAWLVAWIPFCRKVWSEKRKGRGSFGDLGGGNYVKIGTVCGDVR